MDQRLLAWGLRPRLPHHLPRLWLFTDERRLTDPRAAVARLPVGRAGVVMRHDGDPARAVIALDVARICRARRLVLVVAGDVRLAARLRAGIHLRGGRWPGVVRAPGLRTSSAHSVPDIRRAQGAGAALVFLSPVFATASHPGVAALGPLRWAAMVRRFRSGELPAIAALGGIDGLSRKRLPQRILPAVGAIGALGVGRSDLLGR